MGAKDIIVNQWGSTRAEQLFAHELLEAIDTDYGLSRGDYLDEGSKKSKGMVIELYDKHIAVITEFEGFNVSVWMEDGRDVLMQLYPPRGEAMFLDYAFFMESADKTFDRVFDGVCEAMAEDYSHRQGHRVYLVHDRKRKGMDVLEVRLIGLYRIPAWKTTMVDVLKLLEKKTSQRDMN